MPAGCAPAVPRFDLERLEGRALPAPYTLTPVVPALDPAAAARLTDVFHRGQAAGNRADVFTRAGDSITFATTFLVPLGAPSAADGAGGGALAGTLAYFRAGRVGTHNSFTNPSTAAHGGWTSADVLAHLPGELAAVKPAFLLVMVGTNDISLGVSADAYRQNLTAIAQTALNAGVIPVISTVPDILLYPTAEARQPQFNQIVEDVGESLGVPVWNYWRALQDLPNLGIGSDGVHPSTSPGGGGDLSAAGLNYGYNVRNLTAVETLDELRRAIVLGQPQLPEGADGWAPLTGAVAVAAGGGPGFQVQVVDPATRAVLFGFDPYPGFRGAVQVATGDVNGDGVPDLIATPGPGGPPHVKVFDGQTGALLASFYAFDAGLQTGLSVAVGDVTGDGRGDVIVAPQTGGPAHVKAFTVGGQLVRSFYAFDPAFLGGAQLAAGDVDGDGVADIVVSAGLGGSGHTVVYSGATGRLLASFLPFGAGFRGEVAVAAGDFGGTGRAQVAVGVAAGADPHVVVFDPLSQARVGSFDAYAPTYLGGVQLGTYTHGGRTDLLALSNTAVTADVRRFDLLGTQVDGFVLSGVGLDRRASFGG